MPPDKRHGSERLPESTRASVPTRQGYKVSLTGGAQESRVIGGTHQISERMAAQLGDRVRLGAVVRTITQDTDGVRVAYEGDEVTARWICPAFS